MIIIFKYLYQYVLYVKNFYSVFRQIKDNTTYEDKYENTYQAFNIINGTCKMLEIISSVFKERNYVKI